MPSDERASVRAMMRKSVLVRLSTATSTFLTISAAGITVRPAACPHFFGKS